MWIWDGTVDVLKLRWQRGASHALGQCSHLRMGSLGGNAIGDAGARDLGAALQVNTTLTTLE